MADKPEAQEPHASPSRQEPVKDGIVMKYSPNTE